jgi:hypothetical protein
MANQSSSFKFISGGLFALVVALFVAALAVFGVISMNIGHLLMACSALVGAFLIWKEVIPSKSRRVKSAAVFVLFCLFGLADYGVVNIKHAEAANAQQSYSGPSFAISTPVTYKSNPQTPAFWSVVNDYAKSPIHVVVYLRIQSLRSTKIDLQDLIIEGRSASGPWFTFTRIASGSTYAVLTSFTEAHPIGKKGFLDQNISEEIEPGGIREGWVLLQYPNAHVNFANQFKVTLTDLAGNSFTSGILESEMNPGSVRDQGLPIEPGIVDISRYVTLGIQP